MKLRPWLGILAACCVGACDGPAVVTPDSGPDDAARFDTTAPTVRDTTPAEGDTDVARDAELVIRFSEPMTRVGTVRIEPDGDTAGGAIWDASGSTARITPLAGWPPGEVTVSLGDFSDLAGNSLATTTISFVTVDDVGPRVVEATPTEGATSVSARTSEIVLTFDEPMRTSSGTLDVLGGSATIGGGVWSNGAMTITFPVADLEYARDYDATLRNFFDARGNRLDGRGLLEDGILDFSTGPDVDAPRVVRAEPAEGQVDVNPADQTAILVTFDEPMDTTISDVSLSDGTTTTPLVGTWPGSSRTILRVEALGLLVFGRSYSLDLGALRDRSGNPIDVVTYLVDGSLDFTVGLDAFSPFVLTSSPAEGETDLGYIETTEISIRFSEAMDTTVVSASLLGGPVPLALVVRWTSTTEAILDVEGVLRAGTAYSLDLTGMRDTRGNVLDAAHAPLGDGHLDFTTGAPIGEGCRDPLTIAEATETAGAYAWTIGSRDASIRDGGTASCDPDTGANGSDLLIQYDKVSAAVGAGGRHLRIELDGSTGTATGSNTFDIAVMTGPTCDPAAAPTRCHSNAAFHQLDLDLPAGPVWIWVSRTSSSTTAVSATVTVSEVLPPRVEGDSCERPFTSASAIYTAPSGTVTAHQFAIPANAVRGADLGTRPAVAPNAFVCDTTSGHGIDSVIEFDKPDDASVLRVTARRVSGSDSFSMMVVDACDATIPGTSVLGCRTGVSTTANSFLVDAPAGPVYVWLGDTLSTVSRSASAWVWSPEIDVDIEVIPDVTSGEICSRAAAATLGANAVMGTSDVGLDRPSCFGATSNVEWYRVTTTSAVLLADTDVAAGLAIFDPATTREISCVPDARARTLTRVLPVGTEVCVAVEMGRGVSSLSIRGQSYTGLGSTAPVQLDVLRPLSTTGTEESLTSDYWMGVTSDALLMRYSSSVLDVSRAGGERAVKRSTSDGVTSTVLGRTGVVAGGALFSFSSTTTTTAQRITRLWDGRSAIWSPVTWDLTPSYVASSAIMASAPSGPSDIVFVTDTTTTTAPATVFYRISTLAPGTPQLLGTSTRLRATRGVAVDDQFAYLQSTLDGARGIFRVPLSNVAAEPVTLALSASFSTSTTQATAMSVDRLVGPQNLYVRNASGEVEAIIDPAGATPFYLGPVIDLGVAGDWPMTLDHATGQLFLFETETVSTGNFVRYDP